jgi:uncharacterized protein YjbI with pentapeptide repeats
VGNTIGQANAVSDRVLDLRQCVYKGANLSGKVLSGALMSEADFSGANLRVRLCFPPAQFSWNALHAGGDCGKMYHRGRRWPMLVHHWIQFFGIHICRHTGNPSMAVLRLEIVSVISVISVMQEAVLTKSYAVKSSFEGADMTNAVIDRVDFNYANMKSVKFTNAVITGTEFKGTDFTDADFEGALIGNEDAKRLCEPAPRLFVSVVWSAG